MGQPDARQGDRLLLKLLNALQTVAQMQPAKLSGQ
jgi:hypothetical protein